jgi:hypothetical protein
MMKNKRPEPKPKHKDDTRETRLMQKIDAKNTLTVVKNGERKRPGAFHYF